MNQQEKALEIAMQLVDRQRRAIIERDPSLWMQIFHAEDDIDAQLQRSWFEGYLQRVTPQKVSVQLLEAEPQGDTVLAVVFLRFEYAAYDPVQEIYHYTLAFLPVLRQWFVVQSSKILDPFLPQVDREPISWSKQRASLLEAVPWWPSEHELELVYASQDPLPIHLYAKAVARTVLFREEHPELECASILADLMAYSTTKLAIQLMATDPLVVLARLYDLFQNHFTIETTRIDRDNSWQSKLNAPWFGFDEVQAFDRQQGHLLTNCSSLMSLFAALLRLCGFGPLQVIQVRLHNHDVLVVGTKGERFLLGPDKFISLSPRTLYYTTQIHKLFSDTWYWNRFGITNLDPQLIDDFLALFQEIHSPFHPPRPNRINYVTPVPYEAALHMKPADIVPEPQRQVRSLVLQKSRHYPYSPFTWAKYAYQTLLVPKPQVYAAWSLQSPLVRTQLQRHTSLLAFVETVRSLGTTSIFPEQERVMTADQVLRHRRGDGKGMALLMWTGFKAYEEGEGCVAYTDRGSYCVRREGARWRIWSAEKVKLVEELEGRLLVAFDERDCFWDLPEEKRPPESLPSWYPIVVR